MPEVHALVVEAAGRVLLGQLEELVLVERHADRGGGAGHDREVGEAYLALLHRLRALSQLMEAVAYRQPVGGAR